MTNNLAQRLETSFADAERNNAAAKPKLLFLCQTLPYPPDGGVSIRTYNIMRLLARSFDITALCFFRKKERPTKAMVDASLAQLRRFGKVEAFAIPQEHSRLRWLADHARSIALQRAYTLYAYKSSSFERRLRTILAISQFDLVHLDSLDLSAYLPLLQGLPIACTHQNVESVLLRRRAQQESSAVFRKYIERQAYLTEKEERFWCGRMALNVMVSDDDAAMLKGLVPSARVVVIPNGVDTEVFQPAKPSQSGLVFVGGHAWFPNRDAMSYFAEIILPRLRARGVDTPVTWVGRAPRGVQEEFARAYGIQLTGYVSDIREYVQSAACYIVPLRTGGGTRLKILDAWAMGKAVVSTSVGCEGLEAIDGDNILIRDDPDEFAAAIELVVRDTATRDRLGRNARATVERAYDWEVIAETLARQYATLLERRVD